MKILFVSQYYQSSGGTEQYMLSLIDELEQRGQEISIIYGTKSKNTLAPAQRQVFYLPQINFWNGYLGMRTKKNIAGILKSVHPDAIYIHNVANFNLIAYLAAQRPLVRFVHDHRLFCPKGDKLFWFSNQGCNFPCGRACLINTYKKGCLTLLPPFNLLKIRNVNLAMAVHRKLNLIVASSYMKDCLLQNGFSAERIEILPYFCNFSPSLERGMENFVLFAGRIVWQKGLRCLIKSMKNWPEELRLVVAGEGPDLAYSKFLARRLGLSQKIIFLGAVENKQLKDYYERCLLLAMPSLWDEPFGIVGLEAMFCAKPVIAFNVGGISDWLKNEINGFLIERNRMKNFTEKIVYLFSHKDRARQMGLEGEKIYHAGFSKDQHVGRLLEIFKNL